jgi:hypothetical protein
MCCFGELPGACLLHSRSNVLCLAAPRERPVTRREYSALRFAVRVVIILVRQAGAETVRTVREDRDDLYGSALASDQADALAGALTSVVFRVAALDWFDVLRRIAARDEASRRLTHAEIEGRNARALASVPSGTDIVLLWGAGHIPGLAAHLRKAGHRRQSTQWMTVGQLPALWACIKIIRQYYPAVP